MVVRNIVTTGTPEQQIEALKNQNRILIEQINKMIEDMTALTARVTELENSSGP